MKYRKGYKYQVYEDLVLQTVVRGFTVNDTFFTLDSTGRLLIRVNYAWDGASGPTWDDETNMTPSLAHDAFYQMMREGYLPQSLKDTVDRQFKDMCLERGMCSFRAAYYLEGVHLFGASSCKEQPDKVYEVK